MTYTFYSFHESPEQTAYTANLSRFKLIIICFVARLATTRLCVEPSRYKY